jgi:uncharacterized coiled-coil protein SlyX
VPLELFEVFVEALKTGTKVPVTKDNVGAISLLAKEFWLEDLLSECSALQIASTPELIAALSERISKLEHQISSQPLAIAELKESIANHERRLERLDSRISMLEPNLRTEVTALKSLIATPTPVLPVSLPKSHKTVDFQLQTAKKSWFSKARPINEFDGIISYLTRKHGIVLITSKSVDEGDVQNLGDLASRSGFRSNDEAGQWVCWEFRDSLIRPTHYTIRSAEDNYPKSWVLEGSMNGEDWTELDRRKNDSHLKEDLAVHTFEVKSPFECRFIRLTQTGKNHSDSHRLAFCSLEIFGGLEQSVHGHFPLRKPESLDGIIFYLTRKHGGNVHDKGIVTITSKSVDHNPRYALRNAADLTSDLFFHSENQPGQWICLDFRKLRVRPTHYTIIAACLKSWVVESSLDGEAWTQIDRKTDNQDFKDAPERASFAVSNSAECRFIRLTQTGQTHYWNDILSIKAFEFFGTLLE